MRIIEYKIPNQIFVKAEITKLTPLPITNDTNSYNMVIPSVTSSLPNNIMFIQETLLIPPYTTSNYIPKIVKLGVTLSQSMATALPKGIELKLLVIDNIAAQLNITDVSNVKANNKLQQRFVPIDSDNVVRKLEENDNVILTDDAKIPVDKERKHLLDSIDNVILKREGYTVGNVVNDVQPIIKEVELPNQNTHHQESLQPQILTNVDNGAPIKRGRGRPRKNPIAELSKEAKNEFQTLLLEETDS